MSNKQKNFTIAKTTLKPGERKKIDIDIVRMYDFTEMSIPVEVIHGKKEGPVLFVCAAIHGDEINGVEIIKRLLCSKTLKNIKGTLIAVPIVNVFGFNTKSRYLPDRRDLNRCFPGVADGSLASQIAYNFMEEVVSQATHGIDLHTGAIHRSNLPQIRACIDDKETKKLAEAFRVPVIINSSLRDGSLREAGREKQIPILLYEGGEALRFNENVIRMGLKGIISVMHSIGMLPPRYERKAKSFIARSSYWTRAPHSGIMVPKKKLGDRVNKNDLLGVITDPFGTHKFEVRSKHSGIIIGITMLPLLNEGDAAFHIATFEDVAAAHETIENYQDGLSDKQMDTYIT